MGYLVSFGSVQSNLRMGICPRPDSRAFSNSDPSSVWKVPKSQQFRNIDAEFKIVSTILEIRVYQLS